MEITGRTMLDNDYLESLLRQTEPFVTHLRQIVEGVSKTALCIPEVSDLIQQWCYKPLWLKPSWFETLTKRCDFILTPEQSPVVAVLTAWPANWKGVLHDHRTWSVVGCLFGQLHNSQWQPSTKLSSALERVYLQRKEAVTMQKRDVISASEDAIYHVDNPQQQGVALSLHVYGANVLQQQRYIYKPLDAENHAQLPHEEPCHFQLHPHPNDTFFDLASAKID